MDRKQNLPAFSILMYFKWPERVTKEVKENRRLKTTGHQLLIGRYTPHRKITLLFCWSNLILVGRAKDPVSPFPPTGDGKGPSSAQHTTHLSAPGAALWCLRGHQLHLLQNILLLRWYPLGWGCHGKYFYCVPHLSCSNFQAMHLNWWVPCARTLCAHADSQRCSWTNTRDVPLPFLHVQYQLEGLYRPWLPC